MIDVHQKLAGISLFLLMSGVMPRDVRLGEPWFSEGVDFENLEA
jgi:hypothetical protein